MGHIFSIPPASTHPRTIAPPLVNFFGYDESCRRAEVLQSAKRPVAAMAADYRSGGISTRHCHRRAQFLHGLTGVMTVITENGSFAVTPQQALWIPANAIHQSRCWGDVTLRTLYVEADASTDLPQDFRLIEVPPLLRALVNEAVTFPVEYDVTGREGQIMAFILAEIGRMPALPLRLPIPQDRRLARICEAILREPANNHDLEHWTQVGGLGRRTLTRLFRKETGMSFAEWRQQVRLMEALTRLTMREPVTTIALDLGYDSPSAFTAMFRRAMGISPRDYLRFSDSNGLELHP